MAHYMPKTNPSASGLHTSKEQVTSCRSTAQIVTFLHTPMKVSATSLSNFSAEFETVNRIIELCFEKTKRAKTQSNDQSSLKSDSMPGNSVSDQKSSKAEVIDKLTLIKSYE